jgi:hypothetical protein
LAGKGTRSKAYEDLGIVCANPRWGWSGRSVDQSKVALLFWFDKLNNRRMIYNDTGWGDTKIVRKTGNKQRMRDIKHAIEHLDGLVHLVVAKAKNDQLLDRRIKEAYPIHRFLMKITHFDDVTGEWCAEQITDK